MKCAIEVRRKPEIWWTPWGMMQGRWKRNLRLVLGVYFVCSVAFTSAVAMEALGWI